MTPALQTTYYPDDLCIGSEHILKQASPQVTRSPSQLVFQRTLAWDVQLASSEGSDVQFLQIQSPLANDFNLIVHRDIGSKIR